MYKRQDFGSALRTVGGARFAQDEIEDDPQPVGDKHCKECPPQAAHAAPARVPVDVADQNDVAGEQRSRDGACLLYTSRCV